MTARRRAGLRCEKDGRDGGKRRKRAAYAGSSELGEPVYQHRRAGGRTGVAVPTSYDELVAACASLAQKGVTPIANAMCEWAEIALDCAAMLGAPADQYGQQTSLDGAKSVLTALTQVGAFGVDPWNLTDEQAQQAFAEGVAAMRFDGSDLAETLPEARQEEDDCFVPFRHGRTRRAPRWSARPSYGLAITRACWQDGARREAALSLVKKMLTGEGLAALAAPPIPPRWDGAPRR